MALHVRTAQSAARLALLLLVSPLSLPTCTPPSKLTLPFLRLPPHKSLLSAPWGPVGSARQPPRNPARLTMRSTAHLALAGLPRRTRPLAAPFLLKAARLTGSLARSVHTPTKNEHLVALCRCGRFLAIPPALRLFISRSKKGLLGFPRIVNLYSRGK